MATDQKTTLLTLEERTICERVSMIGEAPHSQRAQVLLALDDGLSQTEAGERTGLTSGQVKYWLSKFRQHRTGIFPENLLVQPESDEAPDNEPKPDKIVETTDAVQPAKTDGKKIKKSKKAKGKKKKSKDVKGKSAKKKKKGSKKGDKKAKSKKKKDRKKEKSKKAKKGKG